MSFSGYVGGHKSENVKARRARHPELLIERAVRGMIPHNRLGRSVYRKLKVYRGDTHPHAAQQPAPVKLRKEKITWHQHRKSSPPVVARLRSRVCDRTPAAVKSTSMDAALKK